MFYEWLTCCWFWIWAWIPCTELKTHWYKWDQLLQGLKVSASSCGGMGRKRFGPFQFYVGSGSHCGWKKVLSRVHHLAIIKQVINIFLRRMVRKQAADDCHEITALHRHLYDSSLIWLGVCATGQKFRLSSPPSFFFQRWELGRGLECRETVKWLVLASPSYPFLSFSRMLLPVLWVEAGQRRIRLLERLGEQRN